MRNFYRFVADLPAAIISIPVCLRKLLSRISRGFTLPGARPMILNLNESGRGANFLSNFRSGICRDNSDLRTTGVQGPRVNLVTRIRRLGGEVTVRVEKERKEKDVNQFHVIRGTSNRNIASARSAHDE